MNPLLDALTEAGRQAGLTARHAISGVGGMASAFANPLALALNEGLELAGSDYRFPDQYAALQRAMTEAGLPEPQGALERGIGFAAEIGVPDPTDSAKVVSSLSHMIDPELAAMLIGQRAYHGTNAAFDVADESKRGANTKARTARMADWYVDNPETAAGYADYAALDAPVQRLIDASYAAERRGDWDAAHDLMVQAETLEKNLLESGINGQNIRPVTIDGDFYEVDAGGRTWGDLDDNQVAEWIREAKRGGFKGLKISELSDEAAYGVDRPATHFAVFDQAVVKPLFSQ